MAKGKRGGKVAANKKKSEAASSSKQAPKERKVFASRNTPVDIKVRQLSVTVKGVDLLHECELNLNYGHRYGLIGRNGVGKSTLMRMIAFRDGDCAQIPSDVNTYFLDEEVEASDKTALQSVVDADEERSLLLEEEAQLMEEEGADSAERLAEVFERMEEIESDSAEARAAEILAGLQFTPEMQQQPTKSFSGGWRMRISLARALFLKPTLMLLDEPTNHLDLEACIWLEHYLQSFTKILLVVSHARDFLNGVCTDIIHMANSTLVTYTGNYNQFLISKAEHDRRRQQQYEWEQDQINHMKDYIARFGGGNAKMARQAQSKMKTLEKMERSGLTEKTRDAAIKNFYFPDPGSISPPVLQFKEVAFFYPSKPDKLIFKHLDFNIDLESRIALVGPNGAGKSTLIKLILGELEPSQGMILRSIKLRMAHFSQHFMDQLDHNSSPLRWMLSQYPEIHDEDMRGHIGKYGLPGHLHLSPIHMLSGGQKSRLVFAWLAWKSPHLILFDEPTNHLDIETIDSLAEAINQFQGGVIVVSHDSRLIALTAKQIWVVGDKEVKPLKGDIQTYRNQVIKHMKTDNMSSSSHVAVGH